MNVFAYRRPMRPALLLLVILLFVSAGSARRRHEPLSRPHGGPRIYRRDVPFIVSREFLTGRFNYRRDTGFVRVPHAYGRSGVYLKKETLAAFTAMREAAASAGIELFILSGTRSFYDQSGKWDGEWKTAADPHADDRTHVEKMLRWWSMPGTSRHHWGTDIDLNNLHPSWFETRAGRAMYEWMTVNAARFGFYQPFNANRAVGYREEKWHWSYTPLSRKYLGAYLASITNEDLARLRIQGASVAPGIDIVNNWVNGINPACK